jgi:tripartite-type tricarboxylate transporter receptor subunit TctC
MPSRRHLFGAGGAAALPAGPPLPTARAQDVLRQAAVTVAFPAGGALSGASQHFAGVMLGRAAGIELTLVPLSRRRPPSQTFWVATSRPP